MSVTALKNPLLIGEGLPPFESIQPDHIVPGVKELLHTLTQELEAIEAHVDPTWSGLVEPLTRLEERLRWTWGIISHLMGVKNSPELRTAYETIQADLVQFGSRMGQSRPIYEGFQAIKPKAPNGRP
jgi:oligopeptidase A